MGLLKTILKVMAMGVVAVAALTIAGRLRQRYPGISANPDTQLSAAGFFLLSRDDTANPKVIIMTPPNCPSQEAQRGIALGAALAVVGIPYEMKSEIGCTFHDPADLARVQKYMANIANPVVIIRGRAKGNPTYNEVVAEYRTGR